MLDFNPQVEVSHPPLTGGLIPLTKKYIYIKKEKNIPIYKAFKLQSLL